MKLKYSMLDHLQRLTNREIDFLLYIARFQDEKGNVKGIYYKDVCRNAGMCKQTFYSTLYALERKGICTYRKASDYDYDIKILNNDFSYPDALKEGYIMLNREVFRSRNFKKCRAKAKCLFLQLMKITYSNRGKFIKNRTEFIKKYTEELKVCERVLRQYLHQINSFFEIKLLDGKYCISYIARKFTECVQSGLEQGRKHLAGTILRRNKIKAGEGEIDDLATLIRQYTPEAKRRGYDIENLLMQAVRAALEESGSVFRIKRVHMLVRKCFE